MVPTVIATPVGAKNPRNPLKKGFVAVAVILTIFPGMLPSGAMILRVGQAMPVATRFLQKTFWIAAKRALGSSLTWPCPVDIYRADSSKACWRVERT